MKNLSFRWLVPFLVLLAFVTRASAFDWNAARNELGSVEVKDTTATQIEKGAEKKSWTEAPSVLVEAKTMMLVPKTATAEFQVTQAGWIFFLGFFGFDGRNGDWRKECWDEKRLAQEGWTEISAPEIGGSMIQADRSRAWKIFAKRVPAGETGKIRLNKYEPPRFLSFSETPPSLTATTPSEPAKPSVASVSGPAAAQSVNASDLVKTNRSNLVFVTTPDGAGSGFIASYGTGTFLITNAHVAAGAKGAMFKTLDGTQVQIGAPAAAVGHDIFLMGLKPGGTPLQVMIGVDQNASIGDEVVVLGNAEGAGVINTIKGKIVGVGPNLVEVDAPFQPGNSGSPIIHLKTGKVIGVATYLTIRKYDSATKEAVKEPIIRRFGYRLDSVKSWQPVNWQSFYAQANEMEGIEKLTKDLVAFLRDLGKDGRVNRGAHTNPLIKTRIDQWIEAKSKRLSPRDASTADQSMISFLKVTCQSDVGAAQQHLTYDYFQRQLADQQRERTELAGVFSKIIDNLRQ